MIEYKRTILEVWPLAADDTAVWLLTGDDALYSTDGIPYDHAEHFEVVTALSRFGFELDPAHPGNHLLGVPLLHQTSSRENDPREDPRFGYNLIHTWVAVAGNRSGWALDRWPYALPITEALLADVGNPPSHAADARPFPRRIDVLHHAVRHLAFLNLYDTTSAKALTPEWAPHLRRLRPALAGLYRGNLAS